MNVKGKLSSGNVVCLLSKNMGNLGKNEQFTKRDLKWIETSTVRRWVYPPVLAITETFREKKVIKPLVPHGASGGG